MEILAGILAFFGLAYLLFFHQRENATPEQVRQDDIGKGCAIILILALLYGAFHLVWSVFGLGGFIQNIAQIR